MDEGVARGRDWLAGRCGVLQAAPRRLVHRARPGGGGWGKNVDRTTSRRRWRGARRGAVPRRPRRLVDGRGGWENGHGGAETVEGETLSVLVASGVAVTGTLLGAAVAGWMSRTTTLAAISRQSEIDRVREREQRIWESRKDAYVRILAKLKEALGKAEVVEWGVAELGAERYFAAEVWGNETGAMGAAWKDSQAEFDLGELIVSDKFAERFRGLERCVALATDPNNLPPEVCEIELVCFREAYPELLRLAREDIDPGGD